VKQPGHAAMTRWTTKGWMTCLGAGFEYCTWEDNRCGLDFQLETLARAAVPNDLAYMHQVTRLEWAASIHQESNQSILTGFLPDSNNLWYALSMMQRHRLAATGPVKKAVPTNTGVVSKLERLLNQPTVSYEPSSVGGNDGMILIPGTSCSSPSTDTNKILFLKSFLGGRQLFIGDGTEVTYTLACDALPPNATKYKLQLFLCTVHRGEEPLMLTVVNNGTEWDNDSLSVASVNVPYTEGMWVDTEPVVIELGGPGYVSTSLSFVRQSTLGGISLKHITLTPLDD
jgi:hypothetical protein